MENANITNVVLDKKIDSYSYEEENFIAPHEITVTITLSEYRKLIKEVATKQADIDKANSDRYARSLENEKLKQEISELQAELYKIQKSKNEMNETIE